MQLPKLEKGSVIGIFSPSAPITTDSPSGLKIAEKFLIEKGFKIKYGSLTGKSDSEYRSGTIKQRAYELNELIYDNEVTCIMAAAGGYVSTSILPYIDYAYLKSHPKIIVGHSDVTSVLLAIYEKCGFPVFYGTNFITSFAHKRIYQEYALNALLQAVNESNFTISTPEFYTDESTAYDLPEGEFYEAINNELEIPNKMITASTGIATGRLIGGNLDNLSLIYGNPYCPEIKNGDILFFENVGEEADFFERVIANLYTFKVFDKIGGLIIGKAKNYDDIGSGKKEINILNEFIPNPKFPILLDFDCGHTVPITTLPIGKIATLDTDRQTLKIL